MCTNAVKDLSRTNSIHCLISSVFCDVLIISHLQFCASWLCQLLQNQPLVGSKVNPIVLALGTTRRSYLAVEIPSECQECWMERWRRNLPVGRNLDRLCSCKCGRLAPEGACRASEHRALVAIRGYIFELDISSKTKWPCITSVRVERCSSYNSFLSSFVAIETCLVEVHSFLAWVAAAVGSASLAASKTDQIDQISWLLYSKELDSVIECDLEP